MSISLLTELSYREAITEKIVNDLRQYISSKFPGSSSQERSAVFADALKRIIDSHLPDIEPSKKEKIKSDLFKQNVHKIPFSIDYSDIFKATLKFRFLGGAFLNEITRWMNHALDQDIKKENIFEFILNVYKTQDENPEEEISKVIDRVDKKYSSIIVSKIPKPEFEMPTMIQDESQEPVSFFEPIELFDHNEIELHTIINHGITSDYDSMPEIEDCKSDTESIWEFKDIIRYVYSNVKETVEQLVDLLNQIHKIEFPQNLRLHFPISFNKATAIFLTAATLIIVGINASPTSGYTKTEHANLTLSDYSKEWTTSQTIYEPISKMQLSANLAPQAVTSPSTKEPVAVKEESVPLYSKNIKKSIKMRATAYDLSIKSCGKTRSHPLYGITFSGTRAKIGRTVAVDPEAIPIGSRLRITFPEKYKHLDGVYIAEDTGSAVKGDIIDIFFGEDKEGMKTIYNKAMEFGIQSVLVDILE